MIPNYKLSNTNLLRPRKNKPPSYTVLKQPSDKNADYQVTVITPVYNAAKFIHQSIHSVMGQTLGFENIEYILIDDCSTDRSKEILIEYGKTHENITVVLLDCNSGSPGLPRNIGLELASSPYVTFLDADDWLEEDGLQVLYEILEETGDSYAVGRTIKVEGRGTSIIGEHQCCKERRSVSPISIPHIFNHLGPTARMIRTGLIKEQQITFPEMKFAEDKQFFIDVLANCTAISTTTKPIYYVNRMNETKHTRLTNQTNIIQKTNYNMQVVKHILNKNYGLETERLILNRIYEFDLLRGLLTKPHFQRTRLKRLYYYKFRQTLTRTRGLPYDISKNFFNPIHKLIYRLILERKYRAVTKLLEWDRVEKVKEIVVKGQAPYFVAPFLPKEYQYIPVPLYVRYRLLELHGDSSILHFHSYGVARHALKDVLLRDLGNAHLEYVLPLTVKEDGAGRIDMNFDVLKELPAANYSIFVRYDDYLRLNIRLEDKQDSIKQHYQGREFIFYQTAYSNLALKIL